MPNAVLPSRADNGYRGQKSAIAILILLLLLKSAISFGTIVNGRNAATGADGIPIDSYGAAGAQTVVSLMALLGLANLMIAAMGVIVLLRYRALVPLVFVVLLVQQAGRYVILQFLPIVRTGAPPGTTINLVLLGLMALGLLLSLWPRRGAVGAATAAVRGTRP